MCGSGYSHVQGGTGAICSSRPRRVTKQGDDLSWMSTPTARVSTALHHYTKANGKPQKRQAPGHESFRKISQYQSGSPEHEGCRPAAPLARTAFLLPGAQAYLMLTWLLRLPQTFPVARKPRTRNTPQDPILPALTPRTDSLCPTRRRLHRLPAVSRRAYICAHCVGKGLSTCALQPLYRDHL